MVIAVLGLLLGLLLPALNVARESARKTNCLNHLRQVGLALQLHEQSTGSFPAGFIQSPASATASSDLAMVTRERYIRYVTRFRRSDSSLIALWDSPFPIPGNKPPEKQGPGWGWAAFLLDYMEESALANRMDRQIAVDDPAHASIRTQIIDILVCPSDQDTGVYTVLDDKGKEVAQAATNSYTAMFGSYGLINTDPDNGNGLFQRNSQHSLKSVTDGLSKTIAIGERGAILAQSPWAGVMTGGTCRTRVGAPVYTSTAELAPSMVMARVGKRTLNSPFSEPYDFFSPHTAVVQFVYADASARGLHSDIDLEVFHAMATRNGQETNDSDAR